MLSDHIDIMTCNLCGARDVKVIYCSEDYPDKRYGNVVRCNFCGLIYRNSSNSNPVLIGTNFQPYKRPEYPDEITSGRISIYKEYVQDISQFRRYNRILDVGTGQGFFLKLCSENGWKVWGIEKYPELTKFANKEYGIQVTTGTLEETQYPENFFDAVTFLNVLEHVAEPDLALKEAFRILRPGGAIFLRFPNALLHVFFRLLITKIYRIWKGVKDFDHFVIHTYAFSKSTISSYLKKTGFINPIVQNSKFRSTIDDHQQPDFQKIVWLMGLGLVDIIDTISRGKCLIASSLSVKAIKPGKEC